MKRIDRRRFLELSAKTTAAAAAGALVTVGGPAGASPATVGGPQRPTTLTTTGDEAPVGVDPEDVLFAWRLDDDRRGAVSAPTGWWSPAPRPAGPRGACGTRGRWPPTTRRSSPTAGRRLRRRPVTSGRCGRPTGLVGGARRANPPPSPPACAPPTGRPSGCDRARPTPARRSTPICAPVLGAGRDVWRGPSPTWPPPTSTSCGSTARSWSQGPSFCFPDQQYYQATDITSALRPGAAQRGRHPPPLVRAGAGATHLGARPAGPGRGALHRRPGGDRARFDRAWRTRRAEWLPAPQRNNDGGRLRGVDRPPPAPRRGGPRPASTTGSGRRPRSWDRSARRPSSISTPSAPASASTRSPPPRSAPWPPARWWSTSASVYAGRPSVSFATGPAVTWCPCTSATPSTPTGRCPPSTTPRAPTSPSGAPSGPAPRTSTPSGTSASAICRSTIRVRPSAHSQVALMARHATMPAVAGGHLHLVATRARPVWALCAHSALYTSHEQFIDTPTREKGQFLWDATNESQVVMRTFGEQNLSWQGLRDEARAQARYWPTTGQINEVYPNDDGPQDYPTFTAIYPEWVWRYYLSTGDKATLSGLLPTLLRLTDYLAGAIDPTTGLVSGLTIHQRRQPVRLRLRHRGRHLHEHPVGQRLPPGGGRRRPGGRQRRRRHPDPTDVIGHAADQRPHDERRRTLRRRSGGRRVPERPLLPAGQPGRPGLRGGAGRRRRAAVARYVASLDISVEPDHGHGAAARPCTRRAGRRRRAHPHRLLLSRVGPPSWPPAAPSPGRPGPRATWWATACPTGGGPRLWWPSRRSCSVPSPLPPGPDDPPTPGGHHPPVGRPRTNGRPGPSPRRPAPTGWPGGRGRSGLSLNLGCRPMPPPSAPSPPSPPVG